MPPMNQKNIPLSAVGTDLGFGGALSTQVQDELDEEAKRKKLLGAGAQSNVARDLGLAPLATGGNFFTP